MLTTEEITQAVNDAGFATVAEFSRFLAVANLVLQRDGMTAAIAAAEAARAAHNADVEAQIQQHRASYNALQAQIIALVAG